MLTVRGSRVAPAFSGWLCQISLNGHGKSRPTYNKPCLLNSHPRDGTPILGALSGNDGGTVSDGRTGLG